MACISNLHKIFIIRSAVEYYLLFIYCRLFLNIDLCMWLWSSEYLESKGNVQILDTMSWNRNCQPNIMITYCLTAFHWLQTRDFDWLRILILCYVVFCASMFGGLKRGFRSLASPILVVNVVGELQPKRTLAASRGFLAAARLSCLF